MTNKTETTETKGGLEDAVLIERGLPVAYATADKAQELLGDDANYADWLAIIELAAVDMIRRASAASGQDGRVFAGIMGAHLTAMAKFGLPSRE